ncbi:methyl-accepting chemotaxis protein [Caldovatus aquaticus]|uniref:HAMP domain-containing protein n=1 Tax=Caldovatus aquaticus TaxID=2865671 RepID=A0ABS7F5G6_9PROT|nr:HAMP domain-containing methyl-accepting chemotaxis protein [Caldovatus aquaticus]MBW8270864.1 HAMP domain-containing protein [Caldovatus aquaticus]
MQFFRNLSVGRKLATSALFAILLSVGLVVLVRWQAATVAEQQAAQDRAIRAELDLRQALATYAAGRAAERDAAAAQVPAELDRLAAEAGQIVASLRGLVEDAAASATRPATREAILAVLPAVEDWHRAFATLVEQRRVLIERRDSRFFPLSGEYDSSLEAVQSALEFDLPPEAKAEARDRYQTFHSAVSEMRIAVQAFLASGAENQAQRARRGLTLARVHLRGVQAAVGDDGPAAAVFRRVGEAALGLAAATEEMIAAGHAVETARREGTGPAGEQIRQALADAGATLRAEGAASRDAVAAAVAQMDLAVLLGGVGMALILAVSGTLTARAIGTPLRRLAGIIDRIAAGETALEVPERGRRDEIGRIAEALETLRGEAARAFARGQMLEQMPIGVMMADPRNDFRITYLNTRATEILRRCEDALPVKADALEGQSVDIFHRDPGRIRALLSDPARLPYRTRIRLGAETLDLTVSAIRDAAGGYAGPMLAWSVATEQARLADSFEAQVGAVVEAVAASAAQVQAAAQALAGAAETSGKEATAVAEAGNRASAEVQAVASAAEEMAASVEEITRRVAEAAEVARRAVEETRATDATVQGLSEAAARIGDVVRLIGDIAGQTNLLALNATIEAARAGEAGKGFAVVAGEVKTLAGQTAKATEEIARQIAGMQQATAQAVEAIRGIGATVERTSEIATAIAAAVEEQGATTREIARSAAQVADSTGTVASRIEAVRRAAGETGEAADALLGAAGGLAEQSTVLRGRAAEFLAAVRRA